MQILSKLTSFYFSWSKIRCPKTFLFRFGFYQSLEKTASNWSKNAKFRRNIHRSSICGRASHRWDTSYLIKSSSQRMRTRVAAEREFFWATKIGTDSVFIGALNNTVCILTYSLVTECQWILTSDSDGYYNVQVIQLCDYNGVNELQLRRSPHKYLQLVATSQGLAQTYIFCCQQVRIVRKRWYLWVINYDPR